MHRHPLFISLFLLSLVIAGLHLVALQLFLYWSFWWFDILVHFLGGLFIALSALWFFFESRFVQLEKKTSKIVLVALLSIFLVGVGWEIFEVVAGIPIEDNFALDTTIDLGMDVLGTLFGLAVFMKFYGGRKDDVQLER